MAIDWKVKFAKNTNITLNKETQEPESHYSATFQRFDDVSPEVILNTVSIGDAILETPEQEKALWDLVFKQYEKEAARIFADSARITELQDAGKVVLVAKEAEVKEIS